MELLRSICRRRYELRNVIVSATLTYATGAVRLDGNK